MELAASPPARGDTEGLPPADAGDPFAPDHPVLRFVLVLAQVVTLALTWQVWEVRGAAPEPGQAGPSGVPSLPLIPWLPAFDVGPLLLVTLVLCVVRPRLGVVLHTLAFVLAACLDQTRLQMKMVSLTLLLWGTLPARGPQLLARAHLVALYFYAGLHKLLSEGYVERMGPGYWKGILPGLGDELAAWMSTGTAWFEMALGVFVIVRVTRWPAAVLAAGMHLTILVTLAIQGTGRNVAVWPWNVALALAAPTLLLTWRHSLRETLRVRAPALATAAVVLLSPLGYHRDLVDPYLAYCLYTDTVKGTLLTSERLDAMRAAGATNVQVPGLDAAYTQALGTPLPPSQRAFVAYYEAVRRPGDVLLIDDPRPWAAERGMSRRMLTTGEDHGHLALQGEWLDYHVDGGRAGQGGTLAGKRHGPWVFWYASGERRSEGAYHEGKRVGAWRNWTRDGAETTMSYPSP
jgi:uncharacterized membrane protein YphA (DoxX/SURF4 family)